MSLPARARVASIINAALGVWIVVAPFALDFGTDAATWNNVIVGLLVLIFGVSSAAQPIGYGASRVLGH